MFAKITSLVSVVSVLSLLGFSSCDVAGEEQPEAVKQRIPTIQGRTRRPEKIEKAQEKSKRWARKQAEAAARRERKLKPEGSVDLEDFFWEWVSRSVWVCYPPNCSAADGRDAREP